MMRDEADPNFFIFSSTDKMLFVTVDINPSRTNHQRQNIVISFHSPLPHHQIHYSAKPEGTSVVAKKTQNKRVNSIPISEKCRKPESTAENPFFHLPKRAPKEEEEERTRVAVLNRDSTSEAKISTNQNARSRSHAMGAVEKRRTSPPSCADRK